MLVKWIVCEVAPESRDAFSRAQSQWRRLESVDGFRGQVGGWDARNTSESCHVACIVGLWRDADSYRDFMSNAHDSVVEASGQAATYTSATTALYEVQLDIGGSRSDLGAAIADSRFLRVADCRLRPGREAHFRKVQADVWNRYMAAAGGLSAGAFSQSIRDTGRFLVTTLWESEQSHAAYVRDVLPKLRERAAVGGDVGKLHGHAAVLEPVWRVCAIS